jgi:hypothetical protein
LLLSGTYNGFPFLSYTEMPQASVFFVVKGLKTSLIKNEKSPPGKIRESKPFLTSKVAPE